jgi:hypothetical protein
MVLAMKVFVGRMKDVMIKQFGSSAWLEIGVDFEAFVLLSNQHSFGSIGGLVIVNPGQF